MTNKFLVIPKKKNSVVKQEFYRKGKQSFYIEKIYSRPEILLDTKINTKKYDAISGMILKKYSFKEGEYDYKTKLVLPDNLPTNDAKLIKRYYKKHEMYCIDEHGWKQSKEITTLYGNFDIQEVAVNELTLFSGELEELLQIIPKEKFDDYAKNGMPYEDYLEFDGESEYCSPIFDERTMLLLNDVEISNFQKLFKEKYDQALSEYNKQYPITKDLNNKQKSELQYAIVGERWIKRAWYTLTIYEEFNFSKLEIHISREKYFGRDDFAEIFTLSYNEKEFEFLENYGANSEEIYLMSSDGKIKDFEVLEEEYDADEDEDEFEDKE
jgi:hypothetical protein